MTNKNSIKLVQIVGVFALVFAALEVSAQYRSSYRRPSSIAASNKQAISYDLGATSGSYDSASYTEVSGALNWYFQPQMSFRNSFFGKLGNNMKSTLGVDSSVRYFLVPDFGYSDQGISIFAGPGIRFSDPQNMALLGEVGTFLRFNQLIIGGGFKTLVYSERGQARDGTDLPDVDNIVFISVGSSSLF